jgi:hypothetical protein
MVVAADRNSEIGTGEGNGNEGSMSSGERNVSHRKLAGAGKTERSTAGWSDREKSRAEGSEKWEIDRKVSR